MHEGELRPGLFHGLGELPPRDGNVCYRYRIDRGELQAVFARADLVVEGEYTFPAVYQYAMETHTVVAQVERDEITVWSTCQHPFLVRAELANLSLELATRVIERELAQPETAKQFVERTIAELAATGNGAGGNGPR